MPELELVIVFPTTHLTLSAKKSLDKAGIKHRTIMKPRRISSDCGLAIRIDSRSLDICQEALTEAQVYDAMGEVLADRCANMVVVGPFQEAQSQSLREVFPAEEPMSVD